jgi:hypothetical protein
MTERMREEELVATLVEIGARLRYPEPTRMAQAVRARLREPRPRSAGWRAPAFAPAFVTLALLLIVVALGLPGVRSAAQEFLHLRGIDIFPVPSVPAPSPTSFPSVSPTLPGTIPGDLVTLEEARRRVHFTVRQPTVSELASPDEVLLDTTGGAERVTLLYRDRAGLPPTQLSGVSALFVEFRGSVDATFFGKGVGPGTTLEEVTVNGGRGFWIAGAPHFFFYRDPAGGIQQETLRLAGNTLIWEQDGVTLRLEASVTKDQALRVAASVR